MNPLALLEQIYSPAGSVHRILLEHSLRVADKAVAVARFVADRQSVDIRFVEEAALLHDIGIGRTAAPEIGCHGQLPYICHGHEGRKILEALGLPRHALVCERHVGVGLNAAEIRCRKLPLPPRDMVPLTLEEQIVTYADLFFSKDPQRRGTERSVNEVRAGVGRYGHHQEMIFDRWHARFSPG